MSESERQLYRLREQIATEAQSKTSKNQRRYEKLLGVKEEPENNASISQACNESKNLTSINRKGGRPPQTANDSSTVVEKQENQPRLCLINENDEQSRRDNPTTSSTQAPLPQPPSIIHQSSPTPPTLKSQSQRQEHRGVINLSQFLNHIQEKQQKEEPTASEVASDSEDNCALCDCCSDESAEELVKQAENHAKRLREEKKHIANDNDNESESSNDSDSESSKDASNFAINWSLSYLPRGYYDALNNDGYDVSDNEIDKEKIKEDEVNYIHSQYDLLYGRCKAYVQECNEIMAHILKGRDLSMSQVKQLTNRIMFCNPIAHFECDLNWK
jgi:hypothetical protein